MYRSEEEYIQNYLLNAKRQKVSDEQFGRNEYKERVRPTPYPSPVGLDQQVTRALTPPSKSYPPALAERESENARHGYDDPERDVDRPKSPNTCNMRLPSESRKSPMSLELPGLKDEKSSLTPAPSNILHFIITEPKYPINVEVLHKVCSKFGEDVVRIVICNRTKEFVTAMFEFNSVKAATDILNAVDGADIYAGSCTLKVIFATASKLNVPSNNSDMWDYTGPKRGILDEPPTDLQSKNTQLELMMLDTLRNSQFQQESKLRPTPEAYPPKNSPRGEFQGRPEFGPQYQHGGGYDGRRGHPYDYRSGYEEERPMGPPMQHMGHLMQHMDGSHFQPPPEMEHGYNDGVLDYPGTVLMFHGMNMSRMNCHRLFNLICQYGNVFRIKFMRSMKCAAMVQMTNPEYANDVAHFCHNLILFNNKLDVCSSAHHSFIQDEDPKLCFQLSDHSPSIRNYRDSPFNRFKFPHESAHLKCCRPSSALHFFGAPPAITEEELKEILMEKGSAEMIRLPRITVTEDVLPYVRPK